MKKAYDNTLSKIFKLLPLFPYLSRGQTTHHYRSEPHMHSCQSNLSFHYVVRLGG